MTRRSLHLVICFVILCAAAATAAPRWRLVAPENSLGAVCITSGDSEVSYHRLEAGTASDIQVRGPRRVKIVTRYVFGPEKSLQAGYTVCVAVDGRDVLDETVTAHTADRRRTCADSGRVGVMRRFYVDVPAGLHTIATTAQAPGGGVVTARFFRERRQRQVEWVSFTPERYLAVDHLEFETGKRSTYYLFDADHPMSCTLHGPTTLEVWTRLDFMQAMSGSQPYVVEVRLDGEPYRNFHYDSKKLQGAEWLDRPSVLAGQRRTLSVVVPKGSHRIELRCLRPSDCGIAAKLRIPAEDIR